MVQEERRKLQLEREQEEREEAEAGPAVELKPLSPITRTSDSPGTTQNDTCGCTSILTFVLQRIMGLTPP